MRGSSVRLWYGFGQDVLGGGQRYNVKTASLACLRPRRVMVKKTLLEWRWSLAGPGKFDEFPARTLEVAAEHVSCSGRVCFLLKGCCGSATCAVATLGTLGDAAGRSGEPTFTMRHGHAQLNYLPRAWRPHPCSLLFGAFTNVHCKKGKVPQPTGTFHPITVTTKPCSSLKPDKRKPSGLTPSKWIICITFYQRFFCFCGWLVPYSIFIICCSTLCFMCSHTPFISLSDSSSGFLKPSGVLISMGLCSVLVRASLGVPSEKKPLVSLVAQDGRYTVVRELGRGGQGAMGLPTWDAEHGLRGSSGCTEEWSSGVMEGFPNGRLPPHSGLPSAPEGVACAGSCPVPGILGASFGHFRPEASCIWPRKRTTTPGSTTALHVPCKEQPGVQGDR